MHMLSIVFGPSPVPWALLYENETRAREALDRYKSYRDASPHTSFEAEDDFGQTVDLKISMIHGVMLEDLEKSKNAMIQRGLHTARTQARAQQLAQSDPVLKAAQMSQGMPILQPMGNGRFS